MGGAEPTAGAMLADVVGDLVVRIDDRAPAALLDQPDAVHQLRTAVRRLRNVLAAFAHYLDPTVAGALRARLAEYGDRLGLARDLEVRAAWCTEVAVEVGLAAALREELVRPLLEAHADAHAALVAWTGSPPAAELHADLCAWAAAPALAEGSARPASVVAREVVAEQAERVLAHAVDFRSDATAVHDLRKAGRRLRHTADAVTRPPAEVLGKPAARLGELGSRVQSLLGDHRDALLLADHVRGVLPDDLGARASYGAVIQAAERAADSSLAAVPEVLADLAAAARRT